MREGLNSIRPARTASGGRATLRAFWATSRCSTSRNGAVAEGKRERERSAIFYPGAGLRGAFEDCCRHRGTVAVVASCAEAQSQWREYVYPDQQYFGALLRT